MDKEGQNSKGAKVFESKDIGSREKPDYFINVDDSEKKAKEREKQAKPIRRRLIIILASIAGVLILAILITIIVNVVKKDRHEVYDGLGLPTDISEVEERTYNMVYTDGNATAEGWKNGLYFLNTLITDMTQEGYDADLTFAIRAFRSKLAYEAGGHDVAVSDALQLANVAANDAQKFSAYDALAWIYMWRGELDESNKYENLMNSLDVPQNQNGGVGGLVTEEEVNADIEEGTKELTERTNEE